jgi:hypothetical protein
MLFHEPLFLIVVSNAVLFLFLFMFRHHEFFFFIFINKLVIALHTLESFPKSINFDFF